jgi:hypothetical protein
VTGFDARRLGERDEPQLKGPGVEVLALGSGNSQSVVRSPNLARSAGNSFAPIGTLRSLSPLPCRIAGHLIGKRTVPLPFAQPFLVFGEERPRLSGDSQGHHMLKPTSRRRGLRIHETR